MDAATRGQRARGHRSGGGGGGGSGGGGREWPSTAAPAAGLSKETATCSKFAGIRTAPACVGRSRRSPSSLRRAQSCDRLPYRSPGALRRECERSSRQKQGCWLQAAKCLSPGSPVGSPVSSFPLWIGCRAVSAARQAPSRALHAAAAVAAPPPLLTSGNTAGSAWPAAERLWSGAPFR